jgi:pimeloyl-ACP methyl ester carboxylesterase
VQIRNFQYIKTNGITLRVVVEGEGALCILVHGFPESWYSWRHLIDPLVAAGYRVAVPDVRGYAGSDKPYEIEAYDMIHMTDDIVGLIDALGEEQAILIGHDWGAPIVYTTAIRYPDRVRAVIGLSVPHLPRGEQSPVDTYKQIYKNRFFYMLYFQEEGVAEKELEADIAAFLRKIYYSGSGESPGGLLTKKGPDATFLEGMIDPDPLPAWLTTEDIEYYAEQFRQSGLRGPINRYRNINRDHHMLPELATSKIQQPALFIAGTEEPVLRFMPGVNLADLMDPWYTDLRGKVFIEGGGHWIQQEKPKEVIEAVLGFLLGLEKA